MAAARVSCWGLATKQGATVRHVGLALFKVKAISPCETRACSSHCGVFCLEGRGLATTTAQATAGPQHNHLPCVEAASPCLVWVCTHSLLGAGHQARSHRMLRRPASLQGPSNPPFRNPCLLLLSSCMFMWHQNNHRLRLEAEPCPPPSRTQASTKHGIRNNTTRRR